MSNALVKFGKWVIRAGLLVFAPCARCCAGNTPCDSFYRATSCAHRSCIQEVPLVAYVCVRLADNAYDPATNATSNVSVFIRGENCFSISRDVKYTRATIPAGSLVIDDTPPFGTARLDATVCTDTRCNPVRFVRCEACRPQDEPVDLVARVDGLPGIVCFSVNFDGNCYACGGNGTICEEDVPAGTLSRVFHAGDVLIGGSCCDCGTAGCDHQYIDPRERCEQATPLPPTLGLKCCCGDTSATRAYIGSQFYSRSVARFGEVNETRFQITGYVSAASPCLTGTRTDYRNGAPIGTNPVEICYVPECPGRVYSPWLALPPPPCSQNGTIQGASGDTLTTNTFNVANCRGFLNQWNTVYLTPPPANADPNQDQIIETRTTAIEWATNLDSGSGCGVGCGEEATAGSSAADWVLGHAPDGSPLTLEGIMP